MRIEPLALAGAATITLSPMVDERGAFARTRCARLFAEAGLPADFVQANQSWNAKRGTLRGLHYQTGADAEDKYIRCVAGAVWDVIVDLRPASVTYGQHVGVELSAKNMVGIYVPKGFAHGFVTLADETVLLYEHTQYYAPGAEAGIRFDDPSLAINWPLVPGTLSAKDMALPYLNRQ